jgi:tungstate transport system ATP-binding protein
LSSTLSSIRFKKGVTRISCDNVLLEIKGIKKIYDKEVLNIDKLTLARGCIYGVIGPSGAGKSTLLRIINLLTPPTNGEMLFQGKPIPRNGQDLIVIQRKMALVFQKTLLFRDSVFNNIAYGLKARGYSRSETAKRVNALLDQVGMKELSNRRAETLSGGEAQRVAIARAVAFEPELLLLDEPTANLDPLNVELIEKIITGLASERKITVVMVTHNVFQARRIADRVIFINQGRIVESGETEQIFNNPQFDTTAAYIAGRMIY